MRLTKVVVNFTRTHPAEVEDMSALVHDPHLKDLMTDQPVVLGLLTGKPPLYAAGSTSAIFVGAVPCRAGMPRR